MCSLPTPAFHLLVYFSWSPQGAAQSAPFEDGKTSTCSRPGQGKLGGGGGQEEGGRRGCGCERGSGVHDPGSVTPWFSYQIL